ncbi:helix-turn-helix transcriptional regulator [Phytomonospora sp. NPDC050363]|uniref:helix-turn-helix domain-containing protein n=1 Tax=Phytomonospora sp. NPDC050363 TaxID=3155642 RepID=UPI0033E70A42
MSVLGQHIKKRRVARNLTQTDVAAMAGLSVDVIAKLEQGQRHAVRWDTLSAIARALDVSVAELVGKPQGLLAGAEDAEVHHLRRAIFDVIEVSEQPPGLEALRGGLGEAWRAYWTGGYAPLARMLPEQIARARASVADAPGRARVSFAAVLADLLHLAASLLAHLAHDDLAALAMHQALAAADESQNPLMVAGLSASRAWLLSRQGLLTEAQNLALATAAQIEPRLSSAPVDQIAVWGENLRYATVALSRAGRHDEAAETQSLVDAAAARVGQLRPERAWTERVTDKTTASGSAPLAGLAFGPTLAAMTAVTIHVTADQPRKALTLQERVERPGTQSPLMRSRHLLNLAWAQMADHRLTDAVTSIRTAEQLAPQALPHQTIARSIVAELLPQRRVQKLPGLVGLAQRMGIDTD